MGLCDKKVLQKPISPATCRSAVLSLKHTLTQKTSEVSPRGDREMARRAHVLSALLVLAHAYAGRFGTRPLPSAAPLAAGAQRCAAPRARRAIGALYAKRKTKKADSLDPASYFKYLAEGEDRTEEDTSPPSDVADPDAAIGPAVTSGADDVSASRVRKTRGSQTAEAIASEASQGYLDLSEELKWYLVQCTPGFERSIGRALPVKAQLAGYGADVRARRRSRVARCVPRARARTLAEFRVAERATTWRGRARPPSLVCRPRSTDRDPSFHPNPFIPSPSPRHPQIVEARVPLRHTLVYQKRAVRSAQRARHPLAALVGRRAWTVVSGLGR